MAAYLCPVLNDQSCDANGVPLSGGKIETYAAGTTTPIATYTDSSGGVAQTNPIVLNSSGRPTNSIWLPAGQAVYLVLKTSAGVVVPGGTFDNVLGVNDPASATSFDQWVTFTSVPHYVSATSFTIGGDQTGIFQKGRRIKSSNTGGTIYSTVASATYGGTNTSVVVVNDSGSLDSGLSSVAYGLASPLNSSLPPSTGFIAQLQDFRLTLTSATPVTTGDVTAASTIYLCPYKGNRIALYNGTQWQVFNSAQVSLALSGLTSSRPYDVFAYSNNGVVTLEALAWTSASARATALAYQDGVLVKSGDATRRYMGSFYALTATTTEDSMRRRLLFNYYHRVRRPLTAQEGTATWNYTLLTYRQANNNPLNQVEVLVGVAEDSVSVTANAHFANSAAGVTASNGIGVDSTTTNSGQVGQASASATGNINSLRATYDGLVAAGYHYFAMLEQSVATGTTTWSGSGVLCGMNGSCLA